MSEKKTILLVDERENIRKARRHQWLTPHFPHLTEGYEFVEAENGHVAQRLLIETSIDAIIVESHFQREISGTELIRWVRQQPQLAHLPIIALMMYSNLASEAPAQVQPLLEAGADDVQHGLSHPVYDQLRAFQRWNWQRPERQRPGCASDYL
ncbi:PleD family two-component system response regulator [Armatimonas sp.]|uniref:response regulator n=1 Tax=Armatimonas sp. TaxID=1872638 RepID=UPI00374DB4BE